MDCRFNKADLARRIERIASKADYIEMHNEDTLSFIAQNQQRLSDAHSFMSRTAATAAVSGLPTRPRTKVS